MIFKIFYTYSHSVWYVENVDEKKNLKCNKHIKFLLSPPLLFTRVLQDIVMFLNNFYTSNPLTFILNLRY